MSPTSQDLQEQRCQLAGVPALATSVGAAEEAACRGAVLILHGLTASKEAQHLDSRALAERGYLAVALDAVGHGERRYPDFAERFADAERGHRSFLDIIAQSAAELPAVIEELHERRWAQPGRLGAIGISMGGFILFGAVVARCRLDAVATIVASPHWVGAPASPHLQLDRFAPTPLLMVTGSDDEVVSPLPARQLFEALRPRYAEQPERLHLLELASEGHMFSPGGWARGWGEVCGWLGRFLVEPS